MIRIYFTKKKFARTYILGLTILLWKLFCCNRHNLSENTEIVIRTKAQYFKWKRLYVDGSSGEAVTEHGNRKRS